MTTAGYHIFETAFGFAGLAWRGNRIAGVVFPEPEINSVRAGLERRADETREEAPPAAMARIIEDVIGLFTGARPDFSSVSLDDQSRPEFDRKVWALTRDIAYGETRSYGDLAAALGDVAFSRRVGQALGRNPFPIIVPCHRVIGAGGEIKGFSATAGVEAKRRLLKVEGAIPRDIFDPR